MTKHIINVDVNLIQKMYENEGRDLGEIAKILGCTKRLVASRVKEYGFKKKQKYDFITKEKLENLYLKEKRSLKEIAKEMGVSLSTIEKRLKSFEIKIRPIGLRKEVSEEILKKLYKEQKKSIKVISNELNVSESLIRNRLNEYGISMNGRKVRLNKYTGIMKDITKDTLVKLYLEENKTRAEIAKIFGVSESNVSYKLNRFGITKPFNFSISKEELEKLYIEENLTQKQICKKFKVCKKVINEKLREYNIEKESKWSWISKEILENLYLEKNLYSEEIAEELKCPRHVVDWYLNKFELKGRKTSIQEQECKLRALERASEGNHERSSYELKLEKRYPTFFKNTYKTIGSELDLLYPDKNIAIEVNGVHWHGVPADSKESDKRHVNKLYLCEEKGIFLLNIFDSIIKYQEKKIFNILDNLLKKDALRDIEGSVGYVKKEVQEKFELENNLEKYKKTDFCVGTYKKGLVLNSLSFNLKNDTIEIENFTTKIGYKEDFLGLINYLKETIQPLKIEVSYDKCFYDGRCFKILGFREFGEELPQKLYVYNKHTVQESEYNKNPEKYKSYTKVYDCGRMKLRLTP